MSLFYRLNFQNGISKILNLNHVSSIVLNKNIVQIKYNSYNMKGLIIFGSGLIENEQHIEEIKCLDEKEASKHFEEIYKKFSKF